MRLLDLNCLRHNAPLWNLHVRQQLWDLTCPLHNPHMCDAFSSPSLDSILCGEEELVRQVHTLFGRNAQVVYELQVQKEMEGVRQEVREVKGESKVEERRSHEHEHVNGMQNSSREPR